VVIAHDCPTGVFIPGIGANDETQVRGSWPDHMLYGALRHRDKVRRVYGQTAPKLWIHGHYHCDYTLIHGGTRFVGLARDEDQLERTVTFLVPEDIID
jgi:hypothetical protein